MDFHTLSRSKSCHGLPGSIQTATQWFHSSQGAPRFWGVHTLCVVPSFTPAHGEGSSGGEAWARLEERLFYGFSHPPPAEGLGLGHSSAFMAVQLCGLWKAQDSVRLPRVQAVHMGQVQGSGFASFMIAASFGVNAFLPGMPSGISRTCTNWPV